MALNPTGIYDTVDIMVAAVNNEEVLTINAGTTVAEGSTGTVITAVMLNTTDVDNTAAQLVCTIDTAVANGTLRLSGVELGLNDTFTQADIDAGNVTYDHDDAQTNFDSFVFTVDDGAGTDSTSSFDIIVTSVNDVPVITSSSVVDVEENQNVVLTVTSDDVNSGAPRCSIVGGPDGNRFSIDELSGDLTFISALDFESPEDAGRNNVYNATATSC